MRAFQFLVLFTFTNVYLLNFSWASQEGAVLLEEPTATTFEKPIHPKTATPLYPLPTGEKMILEGNYKVGGGFGLSYSYEGGSSLSLNPNAEYFFWDNVSLGGSFDFFKSTFTQVVGLGPSGTYYFWEKDQWAAFGAQSLFFTHTSQSNGITQYRFTGLSSLGATYFFIPSVAFGASFNYAYGLDNKSALNRNRALINGSFSIYF